MSLPRYYQSRWLFFRSKTSILRIRPISLRLHHLESYVTVLSNNLSLQKVPSSHLRGQLLCSHGHGKVNIEHRSPRLKVGLLLFSTSTFVAVSHFSNIVPLSTVVGEPQLHVLTFASPAIRQFLCFSAFSVMLENTSSYSVIPTFGDV